MKLTDKEKKIWNQAVDDTLKELKKYDGVIPEESDRLYLVREISEKLKYLEKEKTPQVRLVNKNFHSTFKNKY